MVIHGLVPVVLDEFVAFSGIEVFAHHFSDEFVKGRLRSPAEFFFGFGRIAEQSFDLGGAEVAGIDGNEALSVVVVALLVYALPFPANFHAEFLRCGVDEVSDAVLHAGGDYEVFGGFLLQHKPLHFNIVFGVAPVAFGFHVAEIQGVL